MIQPVDQFTKSALSASTFCLRAYSAIDDLTSDEFNYRPGDAKKLIEEVLPLATLLSHLHKPGLYPRCRYYSGSQTYDARLHLTGDSVDRGFLEAHYYVEITRAAHPKNHLHREAMVKEQSVFLGNNIWREGTRRQGGGIHSKPEVVDGDDRWQSACSWVTDRIAAKQSKAYPTPCILVVALEPTGHLSIDQWAKLSQCLEARVSTSEFDYVCILSPWQQQVIWIKANAPLPSKRLQQVPLRGAAEAQQS